MIGDFPDELSLALREVPAFAAQTAIASYWRHVRRKPLSEAPLETSR
jgi:hypothetical protein